MKTEIQTITPKWAAEVLEALSQAQVTGKFLQRTLRPWLIHKYAEDMIAGQWQLSHQGLAFDVNDNLIDGQHRLMAVVKANVPVQMMVTTGLPRKAMEVVDAGAARLVAHQLQLICGYSRAISYAAVARSVSQFVQDDPRINRSGDWVRLSLGSTRYILESLNFRAPMERAYAITGNHKTINRVHHSAFLAAWSFYWRAYPRKAEEFLTNVCTLTNLGEDDPALATHRYLVGMRPHAKRDSTAGMRIHAQSLLAFDRKQALPMASMRGSKESHVWLLKLDKPTSEQIWKRISG